MSETIEKNRFEAELRRREAENLTAAELSMKILSKAAEALALQCRGMAVDHDEVCEDGDRRQVVRAVFDTGAARMQLKVEAAAARRKEDEDADKD